MTHRLCHPIGRSQSRRSLKVTNYPSGRETRGTASLSFGAPPFTWKRCTSNGLLREVTEQWEPNTLSPVTVTFSHGDSTPGTAVALGYEIDVDALQLVVAVPNVEWVPTARIG